jgi:hypothetical protein
VTQIRQEAVPHTTFDHFRVSLANTNATQATSTPTPLTKGVEIKAAAANTAEVYVGRSDLTTGGTAATDGFPLSAGERLFLPIDDLSKLYLRTGTATQNVLLLFC